MFKKLTVILFMTLLCACSVKQKEDVKEEEYIDPAKDVFIYSLLDDETKERIRLANNGKEYKNYLFEMLGKDVYKEKLLDINNNPVDLSAYQNILIEVVSVECSHCKQQLQLINEFVQETDAAFVQYFNVGNKDEILDFYDDVEIPDNLIIIESNEDLKDYFLHELGLKLYPSMITYHDQKVSFVAEGEADLSSYRKLQKIGFDDVLTDEDFLDENGNDLLHINRSIEDVKNDLSKENQEKIKELDNDEYTEELTYTVMSKQLDFDIISNETSGSYINEIEDYNFYKDKKLVLLYTFLRDNSQTDRVTFINELIDDNPDLSFIVVLIEGMESSSAALNNMKIRFKCPVVSNLSAIPDDFFRFGISSYPTAIFVNKGVFTGGYSNIEGKNKFKKAVELFLKEGCVAYKVNNQTKG